MKEIHPHSCDLGETVAKIEIHHDSKGKVTIKAIGWTKDFEQLDGYWRLFEPTDEAYNKLTEVFSGSKTEWDVCPSYSRIAEIIGGI